jgi:hypothetical protein
MSLEVTSYDYATGRKSSEFYPGMTRRNDHATSVEAAAAVSMHLSEIQGDVLAWFRLVGAGTDSDMESSSLGKIYPGFSTLRKRRGELVAKGLLRDSGLTRKNLRGRNMIVWEVTSTSN